MGKKTTKSLKVDRKIVLVNPQNLLTLKLFVRSTPYLMGNLLLNGVMTDSDRNVNRKY